MNNYFINVGYTLANKIHSTIDPLIYISNETQSIHIPETNQDEVMNVITNLNNSAAGYDELPASIMKQCAVFYIEP